MFRITLSSDIFILSGAFEVEHTEYFFSTITTITLFIVNWSRTEMMETTIINKIGN